MFDSVIQKKNQTKLLGLTIDDKLSWKLHAENIHSKISKVIGLLSRVLDCFTLSALATLYYSFIYPHLLYGIIFWGDVAKYDYESIFRLQKIAVRLLTKSPKYSHTDPIFERNYFLKLDSILKLEMCKFIHRDFFVNKFFDLIQRSVIHSYNTRFNSYIALTTYY